MNLATADEIQSALEVITDRAEAELLDQLGPILAAPEEVRHDLAFALYRKTLDRYSPLTTEVAYAALREDRLTLPSSYSPPVRKTHSNVGFALSKPDPQFHLTRALRGDVMDAYRAPVIGSVDTTSAALRLRETSGLSAARRAKALRSPVLTVSRSLGPGWKALSTAQRSGVWVTAFDTDVVSPGAAKDIRRILRNADRSLDEAEQLLRRSGIPSAWVPAEALTGEQEGVKVNSRAVWARHARHDSCGFCRVMATRGAVYRSEVTAGGKGNNYHRSCRCIPVPSTPDKPYKPAAYVDKWAKGYEKHYYGRGAEKAGSPGELFYRVGRE